MIEGFDTGEHYGPLLKNRCCRQVQQGAGISEHFAAGTFLARLLSRIVCNSQPIHSGNTRVRTSSQLRILCSYKGQIVSVVTCSHKRCRSAPSRCDKLGKLMESSIPRRSERRCFFAACRAEGRRREALAPGKPGGAGNFVAEIDPGVFIGIGYDDEHHGIREFDGENQDGRRKLSFQVEGRGNADAAGDVGVERSAAGWALSASSTGYAAQ
jgi:hypothetical protein